MPRATVDDRHQPLCQECGRKIPHTEPRGRPWHGRGQPRLFCPGKRGDLCRKRFSRRRAAEARKQERRFAAAVRIAEAERGGLPRGKPKITRGAATAQQRAPSKPTKRRRLPAEARDHKRKDRPR